METRKLAAIAGLGGDDRINGGDGADVICGDEGDDRVLGEFTCTTGEIIDECP